MIADDSWKVASTLNTDSWPSDRLSVKVSNLAMVSGSLVAPSLESEESLPSARVTVTLYSSTCFSCTKGNIGKLIPGKIWKKMQTSCIKLFRILWRKWLLSLLTHYCDTHLIGAFLTIGTKTCVQHVPTAQCTQRFLPWMIFAAWSCGPRIINLETLFHAKLEIYNIYIYYTYNNIYWYLLYYCIIFMPLYHKILLLWYIMIHDVKWN